MVLLTLRKSRQQRRATAHEMWARTHHHAFMSLCFNRMSVRSSIRQTLLSVFLSQQRSFLDLLQKVARRKGDTSIQSEEGNFEGDSCQRVFQLNGCPFKYLPYVLITTFKRINLHKNTIQKPEQIPPPQALLLLCILRSFFPFAFLYKAYSQGPTLKCFVGNLKLSFC